MDPREPGLLDSITEQLGVALDSARLFSETQQQAQRERLVGEINARMRQTLDVEAVVRTATNEIYQALGLESLDIWLSANETEDNRNQSREWKRQRRPRLKGWIDREDGCSIVLVIARMRL